MKLPLSWLQAYVDVQDTIPGLVDTLTFSGLEVESIETTGGNLDGVVVGEVTAVEPHPNADKLRICTVRHGDGEQPIVCGAPNVAVGGKYPFAPTGVTLPNGLTLKKAKIRGVVSEGMLCAEDELGLSEGHEGLMDLDPSLEPGTPMNRVLGPSETVFELEVTPNRPDCLSVIGIAREASALYSLPLQRPEIALDVSGAAIDTRVTVDDRLACPRYTARLMENVTIGPSPDWMQKRLTLAGIRPINNVVDITNYVMLETGQPLHAFDFALLRSGEIHVRHARLGETMTTLDGIERELSETTLLICDGEGPVALAGLMGGCGSEISDETTTVLLESACFDPDSVRATSQRLGLRTDSSYRFERGVDPGGVDLASQRAAQLLQEYAGATVRPGLIDIYPEPAQARTLTCRYETACSLIGVDLSASEINAIFSSIELEITSSDDRAVTLSIPTFRSDLTREVDLVEEVARLHGLDKIPAPSPVTRLIPGTDNDTVRALSQCRTNLVGLGLREITTYSLLSPILLDLVQADDPADRIVMPYPLSQDQSVLRSSLIPQMSECLARNHARQIRRAGLFEIGRVYCIGSGKNPHRESLNLAIGLMGPIGRTGMDQRRPVTQEEMFLNLKGLWEEWADKQQLGNCRLKPVPMPVFEPGYAVQILRGKRVIGRLGLLHRKARKEWRFQEPVGVLEVTLDGLVQDTFGSVSLRPVPTFPSTSRDIALIVDESVKNRDILAIVRNVAPKELVHVELFDIFQGEGIGHGKKSMAYSFTYQSEERTLTDEDANAYHTLIRDALKTELHADLRDE